jgi:hypothetical protein
MSARRSKLSEKWMFAHSCRPRPSQVIPTLLEPRGRIHRCKIPVRAIAVKTTADRKSSQKLARRVSRRGVLSLAEIEAKLFGHLALANLLWGAYAFPLEILGRICDWAEG